jgi:cell division protein ZapA
VSTEPVAVTIQILDKDYTVACPLEEKEGLIESARLLNQRMRQVRDSGKVMGAERMAVMTALNVLHESARERQSYERAASATGSAIKALEDKVASALPRRRALREVD